MPTESSNAGPPPPEPVRRLGSQGKITHLGRQPQSETAPNLHDSIFGKPNPSTQSMNLLFPDAESGELGQLDRYRVVRLIGTGGMGMVFEAEDPELERRVALKVIRPEFVADVALRKRFLREARAMAGIDHPNIIPIYHVGQLTLPGKGTLPMFVMPLLQGETLEQRLQRSKVIHYQKLVPIARQIADGLTCIHERGTIHRDIKLANIWLSPPDDQIKILDFGLARPSSTETPGTGSRMDNLWGTPLFMSPEQIQGQEIDGRSDQFSLGVVLYTCLAGQLPFPDQPLAKLLRSIAVDVPTPITQLVPELPPELAELIQRLMAKHPALRYPTTRQMADDLAILEAKWGLDRSSQSLTMAVLSGAIPPPTTRSLPSSVSGSSDHPSINGPQSLTGTVPVAPGAAPLPPVPTESGISRRKALTMMGASVAFGIGIWEIQHNLRSRPIEIIGPTLEPLRIGVALALSGDRAELEAPLVDLLSFAADELNALGGLLGRKVECLIRDSESSIAGYQREAEELLTTQQVAVLFLGGPRISRQVVQSRAAELDRLVIYPLNFEGLESHPNMLFTGATPQQIDLPAIEWCQRQGMTRFAILGDAQAESPVWQAIVKDAITMRNGTVCIQETLPQISELAINRSLQRIQQAKPDILLTNLVGAANRLFFQVLLSLRGSGPLLPTLGLRLDASTIRNIPSETLAGHYVPAMYLDDLPESVNRSFTSRFRQRLGNYRTISDAMAAAYAGVQFWAKAVADRQSLSARDLRTALSGMRLQLPEGPGIRVDANSPYLWKYFRLIQAGHDRQKQVLENSGKLLPPQPFPTSRPLLEWQQLLEKFLPTPS
ncbi:bifunctional serine/threonine-protein kinase/ABC transporter substrate-binding protein [Tuwongella immobilis]|nr:bifunctional serine/threonine-protein kinase/ABC transporter substrate-binding protein [Tuwongella immobilis]